GDQFLQRVARPKFGGQAAPHSRASSGTLPGAVALLCSYAARQSPSNPVVRRGGADRRMTETVPAWLRTVPAMDRADIEDLFAYTVWANARVLDAAAALSDAELRAD